MRIITSESIEAFYNRGNFKKGNRKVVSNETLTTLYLHNNAIARLSLAGQLMISNAGWSSNITKECLNGLKVCMLNKKIGFGILTVKSGAENGLKFPHNLTKRF